MTEKSDLSFVFGLEENIKNNEAKKFQCINQKIEELQGQFVDSGDLKKNGDSFDQKLNFNNDEISYLLEEKSFDSLIQCLRIGALKPEQESTVLNQLIKEDLGPDKLGFLCQIVGRGNYGERLNPELIDYIAQSKDLTSEEVMVNPSNGVYGLSYLLGDRSNYLYQELPDVPNWAISRIWGSLTKENSPLVSNYIVKHISQQTLNKEYEAKGLEYIMNNNLNFETTISLLEMLSKHEPNSIIKQEANKITEKLGELNSYDIENFTTDWWNNKPSSSQIFKKIDFLVENVSILKRINNFDIISNNKKTTETYGVIKFGNDNLYIKSSTEIAAPLYPIEEFLIKNLDKSESLEKTNLHSIDNFKNLITAYRNEKPEEAKDFFKTVIKLGLENKIKLKSEKYQHSIKNLFKEIFK